MVQRESEAIEDTESKALSSLPLFLQVMQTRCLAW